MDVFCHELLAHARAEFFGLDSHTSLTTHGSIRAHKSPGKSSSNSLRRPGKLWMKTLLAKRLLW
jgi:hypothetical protein